MSVPQPPPVLPSNLAPSGNVQSRIKQMTGGIAAPPPPPRALGSRVPPPVPVKPTRKVPAPPPPQKQDASEHEETAPAIKSNDVMPSPSPAPPQPPPPPPTMENRPTSGGTWLEGTPGSSIAAEKNNVPMSSPVDAPPAPPPPQMMSQNGRPKQAWGETLTAETDVSDHKNEMFATSSPDVTSASLRGGAKAATQQFQSTPFQPVQSIPSGASRFVAPLPVSRILGPRDARLRAEMETDYVPSPIGLMGPRMPGMSFFQTGQHSARPALSDARVNSPGMTQRKSPLVSTLVAQKKPPSVNARAAHSKPPPVNTTAVRNYTGELDYRAQLPEAAQPKTPFTPFIAPSTPTPPPPPPVSSIPFRRPGTRSPSKSYGQRPYPSHASSASLQLTHPSKIGAKIPLTRSTAPPAPPPPPISSIPTRRLQSSKQGKTPGRPSSSGITYTRQGTYSHESRASKSALPGHMQPQSISSVDNATDRQNSISGGRGRDGAAPEAEAYYGVREGRGRVGTVHDGRGRAEALYGVREGRGRAGATPEGWRRAEAHYGVREERGRAGTVHDGLGRAEALYGVREGRGRTENAPEGWGRAGYPYGVRGGRSQAETVHEGRGRAESHYGVRMGRCRTETAPEGPEMAESFYGVRGVRNPVGSAPEGRGRAEFHYGVRGRGGVRGSGRGRARGWGIGNSPDSHVGQVKPSLLDPVVDHKHFPDPVTPNLVPLSGLLPPPPPPAGQGARLPQGKQAQLDRATTTREAAGQNASLRDKTGLFQGTLSSGTDDHELLTQSYMSAENPPVIQNSISGRRGRAGATPEGWGRAEHPHGVKEGWGQAGTAHEGRGRAESSYGVGIEQGRAEAPHGVRGGRSRAGTAPEGSGRTDWLYGVRGRGGVRVRGRGRAGGRGTGRGRPPDSHVGQVKSSPSDLLDDYELPPDVVPPSSAPLPPPPLPWLISPPPPPSGKGIRLLPPAKEAQLDRAVITSEADDPSSGQGGDNTGFFQKIASSVSGGIDKLREVLSSSNSKPSVSP